MFNTDEGEAVTAFVALLSTWDKEEIDQKLSQRVEFSKRAIGKLLQAYDRLLQRNGRIFNAMKEKEDEEITKETPLDDDENEGV